MAHYHGLFGLVSQGTPEAAAIDLHTFAGLVMTEPPPALRFMKRDVDDKVRQRWGGGQVQATSDSVRVCVCVCACVCVSVRVCVSCVLW